MKKSFLILMPTILLTAALAYIDRSNVAYAATTIKKQLGISNSQYGLGSGLLYVSYCFFQVTLHRLLCVNLEVTAMLLRKCMCIGTSFV